MRNVLSAHEEELSLSLPDLGVEEVTALLEGLYSRREELWVGGHIHSLLLGGGTNGQANGVKMEPELDLTDWHEAGFQDDIKLDFEQTENMPGVKKETLKKPVKKGKRRELQIKKRENDTNYGEKDTSEKGYIKGYIRLPCDRLNCDVCEIQGFRSEFAVFAHIGKVHGPKQQLECDKEGCQGKTFKKSGALLYHKATRSCSHIIYVSTFFFNTQYPSLDTSQHPVR